MLRRDYEGFGVEARKRGVTIGLRGEVNACGRVLNVFGNLGRVSGRCMLQGREGPYIGFTE